MPASAVASRTPPIGGNSGMLLGASGETACDMQQNSGRGRRARPQKDARFDPPSGARPSTAPNANGNLTERLANVSTAPLQPANGRAGGGGHGRTLHKPGSIPRDGGLHQRLPALRKRPAVRRFSQS